MPKTIQEILNGDIHNHLIKILPFGKYKGESLGDVLAVNKSYFQWLYYQDFVKFRHKEIYVSVETIIKSGEADK